MVQAVVHADRAWVVSDSVCRVRDGGIVCDADGRPYEDAKLIRLRGFVLTGLGSLDLRRAAERHASALDGLDACVERLPQALRDAHRALGLRDLQTVLVIGWSEKNARMSCAVFTAESGFEPEVHGTAANPASITFWRNPDIPREPFARVPDDRESLIANAFATVRHWRQIDPATPIGGPLRLAEITHEAITLSIAGDLGVPITHKEDEMSSRKAIAAMALTLAACGGGGEEIEAQQLAPNAATAVYTDLVSSTTVNSTPNTPIVRTLPKTDPGTYEVTVSGRFDVTSFSSTAQMRVYFQVGVSGTYIGDLNPTYTLMANGQSVQVSQTITVTIGSLADGSVSVMLQIPSGTASGTMSNLCMRSTLIKR